MKAFVASQKVRHETHQEHDSVLIRVLRPRRGRRRLTAMQRGGNPPEVQKSWGCPSLFASVHDQNEDSKKRGQRKAAHCLFPFREAKVGAKSHTFQGALSRARSSNFSTVSQCSSGLWSLRIIRSLLKADSTTASDGVDKTEPKENMHICKNLCLPDHILPRLMGVMIERLGSCLPNGFQNVNQRSPKLLHAPLPMLPYIVHQ